MEATALREAWEETGLVVRLHPSAPRPLEVDAHRIPARKDEPEHWHLDVRYLVVAEGSSALRKDETESLNVRWFTFEEALALADEPALKRLLLKASRWTLRPSDSR
jgi:8-oxo-dGTP pyrophosphatase MutT (NUDIX family)